MITLPLGGPSELEGTTFFYNLSVLAVTFAAVSALVMLVRQTLGGKLSSFDIYLLRAFISFGFAVAIGAILPPLLILFELQRVLIWPIASVLAALMLAVILASVVTTRRKVTSGVVPPVVAVSYGLHALAVVALLVNAAVPAIQGAGPFAAALTLCLANTMWAFVRRIASLIGDKPSEDWDPRRG
jgi:hypothetical protein